MIGIIHYIHVIYTRGRIFEIKINKLDLILYLKTSNLNCILYLIGILIIIIPIGIVFVTEITFSSFLSKILLCSSLAFIIVGKILTANKKNKGDKSIPGDIGVIIGLLIVLVSTAL